MVIVATLLAFWWSMVFWKTGRHFSGPCSGASLSGRHAYGEFAIFFTQLTIRRQNDRLALPYDLGASSMIPKQHVPDLIRRGSRLSGPIVLKGTP
ncbi:MAG: hypothetical protein WA858_15060 [Xanthobacteraceae bacterium]